MSRRVDRLPSETDFTDTVIQGGAEITTYFRRGRRGSRPFRRVSRKAGSAPEGGIAFGSDQTVRGGAPGGLVSAALRLLNDARVKGVRRTSEASFRKHLARHAEGSPTLEIIDSLVRQGIVERDERLDPQGNPLVSYLSLTPDGQSVLDSVFGPVSAGPLDEISRRLKDLLAECRRPVISEFLNRQLDAAVSGGPVSMETGEEAPLTYISPTATPTYLKVLEFFGFVGAHRPGEPLEFKGISGALNHGERDSVKMLEGLRSTIAAVAEFDIGVPLDEMGVRGARLLYWIPFSGDLRPDGNVIWGSVPAISTRDVRNARAFSTVACVVALVENRAALEHLVDGDASRSGWLTICTEGMPKHALYELLAKVDAPSSGQRTYLVWTDWDLGGLRIAERLLGWLADHAGGSHVVLVPHPGMEGRKIEVPAGFLNHRDPRIRAMAQDIALHGAVYQEEAFSVCGLGALEDKVQDS